MKKVQNVLVTGASGLLGTNTIIELLKHGYFVRAYLRNPKKYIGPLHERLKFYQGDILNPTELQLAIEGCTYIIHCAALTDMDNLEYEQYHKVNVIGTKNLVKTAIRNKIHRIIYIGTANMFGYGKINKLGDETKPIEYPYNKLYYSKSKTECSEYLRTKIKEIEVIGIHPGFMIGSFDSKPSSGRILAICLKNRIVFCPPGGKSFINVNDVASAIVTVLKNGANGESYLLVNENLTFYEFFKKVQNFSNRYFMIVKLPIAVMKLLGYIGSILRSFGIKSNFYRESMASLCTKNYYSNLKAKNDLRIKFSSIEHGIKASLQWFTDNGL